MTSETSPHLPAASEEHLPVFREFLYADLDRARSLIAQLAGGVPEEERGTSGASRRFNVGAASYFGYNSERRTEEYQQRSLLDALFPELESILEAEGWLTDISDIIHGDAEVPELTDAVTPGSIVRLTADAQLFDSEYIARVLGGMSVAVGGIGAVATSPDPTPQTSKKHNERKPRNPPIPPNYAETGRLEDLVEPFSSELAAGVTPEMFRGVIRTARGMFHQGLHVLILTRGTAGWTATARLQQGRRYLDAEPDVLFSRYGTTPQEWTIVGTIGHFSEPFQAAGLDDLNFMSDGGMTISRPQFVSGLNALMSHVAGFGFADTPPHPGFSVIPMAVYRIIPKAR